MEGNKILKFIKRIIAIIALSFFVAGLWYLYVIMIKDILFMLVGQL